MDSYSGDKVDERYNREGYMKFRMIEAERGSWVLAKRIQERENKIKTLSALKHIRT